MKRKLILALLILAVSTSFVFAGAFGAGVSAGGNLAFVGTDPSGDGTPRYGFTGGLYGDYALYAVEDVMDLSAQFGLNYAMKGFRTESTSGDVKVNLDYIELPILVKAAFDLNLPVKPFALAGGYVGYAITQTYLVDDSEIDGALLGQDNKDLDFGVTFGAGVDLDMGVSIDARFNLGLANIADEGSALESMKNRSVSLMVSYNIL
ncbi:porin family protein [Pleomorphochaeta sp. DL1XJH-081]|uniref:porin family protein n=1 Tax=Pleomorphochaeta sp. DL1XJH-081 TaxID=3409690 RepID=UPI003BB7DC41